MCARARVCAPRRPVALWCGCHRRDIFEINCSLEVAPGGRDVTSLFAARLYCSFHVLTVVEHISQVLNTLTVVSKYTQTKSRLDDFVATSDETSDAKRRRRSKTTLSYRLDTRHERRRQWHAARLENDSLPLPIITPSPHSNVLWAHAYGGACWLTPNCTLMCLCVCAINKPPPPPH